MNDQLIDISPDSLRKVAKRMKIEFKLKELSIKTEKLKIRSEIEEIDFSDNIKKLDQEIAGLEKEKQEFRDYEQHPILELIQKQKVLQERLKRLNNKKGTIQSSVYDTLKNEYLGEKEAIAQQLNEFIVQLREIIEGASKGTKSLKISIEELTIRKEIEEIPDESYQQRLSDLKSELTHSEELKASAEFLVEMVKNI
ncbi:MAG: hypothetical protein ACXAC8_01415 [Candidatus Hodarchaeales archaeon]